jgi:hypothetical protein
MPSRYAAMNGPGDVLLADTGAMPHRGRFAVKRERISKTTPL